MSEDEAQLAAALILGASIAYIIAIFILAEIWERRLEAKGELERCSCCGVRHCTVHPGEPE